MATDPRRKPASEKELKYLTIRFHLLKFREYPKLNDDCKNHVMGCLDGRTFMRMARCSKKENSLADDVTMRISKIIMKNERFYEAAHNRYGSYEKVYTSFGGADDECCVSFRQSENNVIVESRKGRLIRTQENSEHFKEAVHFFEFLLKKCNYGVEHIELKMGEEAAKWAVRADSPIKSLPNLSGAYLRKQHEVWLKRMPEHLDYLDFESDVASEIIETPQFRNARKIHSPGQCGVTDEQLLQLNAVDISLYRAHCLTGPVFNAFLKRWQSGGGVAGFRSLDIGMITEGVTVEGLLDGLDAVKIKKDEYSCRFSLQNKMRPNEFLECKSNGSSIHAKMYEELSFMDAVPSETVDTPRFRNARTINCQGQCDATDEQLLGLHAVQIHIQTAPLLSENGVKMFLRSWQWGGEVEGFSSLYIGTIGQDNDNVQVEDILLGLNAEKIEEDENDWHYSIQSEVRPNEFLDCKIDGRSFHAKVRWIVSE